MKYFLFYINQRYYFKNFRQDDFLDLDPGRLLEPSTIFLYSSHRSNIDYWKGLNVDGWSEEALGMRKMITQFAGVPAEKIKGKFCTLN